MSALRRLIELPAQHRMASLVLAIAIGTIAGNLLVLL